MAHAERIDETLERDFAPRFDGVEQIADRQFAEALLLLQLDFRVARLEREDVARLLDPALLEEQLDLLLAQPLDVERAARDEMLQVLDLLVRAGELAGAAGDARPRHRSRWPRARPRCGANKDNDLGNLYGFEPFGRFSSTTPSTCGMTSPARWIVTVSPMRTPSRSISSSLCKVAFDTTTPPTVTGSSVQPA